jgi:hypothetical protein
VIDDAFSEEEQNFIEAFMYEQNWRFYKIGFKKVWSLVREDKSFLESLTKNIERKTNPNYTFVHSINEKINEQNHILNNEAYEKISCFIFNRLKQKVVFDEKEITISRSFLYVPLKEDMINCTTGIHFDNYYDNYTFIYYVNDSDGDTVIFEQTKDDYPTLARSTVCYHQELSMFKEHARIPPKKGRIVMFDGARYHCGTQPRTNHRCIINFNLV